MFASTHPVSYRSATFTGMSWRCLQKLRNYEGRYGWKPKCLGL